MRQKSLCITLSKDNHSQNVLRPMLNDLILCCFQCPSPYKAILCLIVRSPSKDPPINQKLCFVRGRGGKSLQSQNSHEGLWQCECLDAKISLSFFRNSSVISMIKREISKYSQGQTTVFLNIIIGIIHPLRNASSREGG